MKARKYLITTACGAALAALLVGCATEYKERSAQIQSQPINCATAEADIQTLQREKVNTARRVAAGVTAFTPIGLVAGMAQGTQGTKMEVASGDYNIMIDKKIAEIKATCGVP